MKRIVAVIYEDGTEASVADMESLERYVHDFRQQQYFRALAADRSIDWDARGKALDQWNAARLAKKKKILASKRKPRGAGKYVAPAKAKETLERIVAANGKWGATKKAARELNVSKRTVNRRMRNSAP